MARATSDVGEHLRDPGPDFYLVASDNVYRDSHYSRAAASPPEVSTGDNGIKPPVQPHPELQHRAAFRAEE